MDQYNGPVERERLPTREMIDAITDLAALREILGSADEAAKKIEVDLDYRTDGDDEWERRARGALSAHRICIGHLNRRIHRLTQGGKVKDPTEAQRAKADGKAAQAAQLKAAAENNRQKRALAREHTMQQVITFASRQCFLGHFHQAAVAQLDQQTVCRITETAQASLQASLDRQIAAELADAAPKFPTTEAA